MPPSGREPVYLDHAATTPVRPEVVQAMEPFFHGRFGNPSSTHRWGREARVALDEARERVATVLGARPDEICFTSCGTESDNMAVLGGWRAHRGEGRNAVVTSAIEHKAILGAVHSAQREGGVERLIPVGHDGVLDVAAADAAVGSDSAVCSVMWVNNEIGTLQPVEHVAELARSRGALFHTDAVQAFGKVEIDVSRQPFDALSLSGHKIGAPKGIGALYVRRGTTMEPLMYGGAQDRGRRPGTENVAFAVALATAMELAAAEREEESARLRTLRDGLEHAILQAVPDAIIHGRASVRAPHIVSVSIPGAESEALLMALDLKGIAASGGSACQSGAVGTSHVLEAMGVAPELIASALRFSLGAMTQASDVERVAEVLPGVVGKARAAAGSLAEF
jgi:cysteine desulfurase